MNGERPQHQTTLHRWSLPQWFTLFPKLCHLQCKTSHQIIGKKAPQSSEASCWRQAVQTNLTVASSFFGHHNTFLREIRIIITYKIHQRSHSNGRDPWSTWEPCPPRTAVDVTGGAAVCLFPTWDTPSIQLPFAVCFSKPGKTLTVLTSKQPPYRSLSTGKFAGNNVLLFIGQ